MATLLLKNVPEKLKSRLAKAAKAHGRSMNQEATRLIADGLDLPFELPEPLKLKFPMTNAFIDKAKRMGRA